MQTSVSEDDIPDYIFHFHLRTQGVIGDWVTQETVQKVSLTDTVQYGLESTRGQFLKVTFQAGLVVFGPGESGCGLQNYC